MTTSSAETSKRMTSSPKQLVDNHPQVELQEACHQVVCLDMVCSQVCSQVCSPVCNQVCSQVCSHNMDTDNHSSRCQDNSQCMDMVLHKVCHRLWPLVNLSSMDTELQDRHLHRTHTANHQSEIPEVERKKKRKKQGFKKSVNQVVSI